MNTEQLTQACKLHTIRTEKYKTNTIVLKFKAPLSEQDVTKRALLSYVLQKGTEQYPSAKQLRRRLNDLYGATLSAQLSKKGDHHIVSFTMEVANETFLSDAPPLLEEALRLLAEVIFRPKVVHGVFDGDIVKKEKRKLKQRIQSVRDDKMRYANMRLIEEMCKRESYRLLPYGKMEEVDAITPEALTTYYRHMLSRDDIDLFVIGDINEDRVKNVVQNTFPFPEHHPVAEDGKKTTSRGHDGKVVIDEDEVSQGKLNLGYRTDITYGDARYFAFVVFNGIFGGFPHSKLFVNVREKESLAYYAASRIEGHKGLLLVFSGIESAHFKKTVGIVKEQMEHMRNGAFTEEECQQTKIMLKNQLLETIDSAKGTVEFHYNGMIAGCERSVDDWFQGIDAVTKEDIVAAAGHLTLDTTYFLKGKEAS